MSEAELHEGGAPPPPKQDPETLVLRGRPRPVIRFRKGLIVGVTGAVAAGIIGLTWASLDPPAFRLAAGEASGEPAREQAPEALADAPDSYGDVPRLGPPLPGDLGRPILQQQRNAGTGAVQDGGPGDLALEHQRAVAAERQRLASERQSARTSPVLVRLAASAAEPQQASSASTSMPQPPPTEASQAAPAAARQGKQDFVRSTSGILNSHALVGRPSPWMLAAGTVIPASLITGLNSDLPGIVLAQVTENVRDSATGKVVLIPQGARLIGNYDSSVGFGQRRLLLVWQRIVFPDGSSIELDKVPATDTSGFAGLQDSVNFHEWQLLKGVALSTLLGVGSELSIGGDGDLVRAIRESAQTSGSRAGDQLVSRNLDVQPTLTVRPGWPVRAILSKDLVLQPWRG